MKYYKVRTVVPSQLENICGHTTCLLTQMYPRNILLVYSNVYYKYDMDACFNTCRASAIHQCVRAYV